MPPIVSVIRLNGGRTVGYICIRGSTVEWKPAAPPGSLGLKTVAFDAILFTRDRANRNSTNSEGIQGFPISHRTDNFLVYISHSYHMVCILKGSVRVYLGAVD